MTYAAAAETCRTSVKGSVLPLPTRTRTRTWTEALLRTAYIARIEDAVLRTRVEHILDWAVDSGRLLIRPPTIQPSFGIGSDSGKGIFSIWEKGEWRGRVCWFFGESFYPEGLAARDRLLDRLEDADPPGLYRWRERQDCVDIARLSDLDEPRFLALCGVWEALGPAPGPAEGG